MKKLIVFFLFIAAVTVQTRAQSPAEQVAARIADKMKDSLSLSVQQRNAVYDINLQLAANKSATRQQYQSTDSLAYKMQQVENTRDGLYRAVLTEQQFILYRQKKRNLVNNN